MSNIEHINELDTLNTGRNKINKHAIDPANRAELNSIDAKSVANQANQTSQSAEAIAINTDDRLDNIIAGEMQDAEVIDARRPFGGEAYATLGERLDEDKAEVSAQLAQISYSLQGLPTGEMNDASIFLQTLFDLARDNKVKKITLPKNTYRIDNPLYIWGGDIEVDFSGSTILSYANAVANKRAEVGIINVHGDTVENDVAIVQYLRSLYPGQHNPPANSPVLQTIEKISETTSRVKTSNNNYFSVDDEVLLNGWTRPEGFPYLASKYEPELHVLAKVLKVDSEYIYIDYASPFNYPTFINNSVFKSRVTKVETVKNVKIKNVKIKDMVRLSVQGNMNTAEQLQATCGISPMLVDGFVLENVEVENHRSPAIYPYATRNLDFKNIHGEKPQSWEVGGYVVCFMMSRNIVGDTITGDGCRHIIDFSTTSNNARIYNTYGVNSKYSDFTSHGQSEHDIHYDNAKGSLGFGSSLVQFPNMNRNYSFKNSELTLVTTVDDSKFSDNINFENCVLTLYSNPTYLNTKIKNSKVNLHLSTHHPVVNKRGQNIKTSFLLENTDVSIYAEDSINVYAYFTGYDDFVLKNTSMTLVEGSENLHLSIIIGNSKRVLFDGLSSDCLRFRYSNTLGGKSSIDVVNSDIENKSHYMLALMNLTDCELKLNISNTRVQYVGSEAPPLNIYYVLQGQLGTFTNSSALGSIHDNVLIGKTIAKIHGTKNANDTILTHDNIIKNLATGSIFDNGENTVV